MEQGKLEQAEQIYRQLLLADAGDPRLREGLAEVQRRRAGALADPSSADSVGLRQDGDALLCIWRVSGEGQARAALVGHGGRLVLRMVAFPIASDAAPKDIPLPDASGQIQVEPPRGASLVGAAVGLLGADGGFVSIAHCLPLSLKG